MCRGGTDLEDGEGGRRGSERQARRSEIQMIFSDENVRRQFVKKVLLLVTIEISIISGSVFLCYNLDEVQEYLYFNYWPLITSAVLYLLLSCSLCCFSEYLSIYPYNYVYLVVQTLIQASFLCCISILYRPELFVRAALLTLLIVALATGAAWVCPCDLTQSICTSAFCLVSIALTSFIVIGYLLKMKLLLIIYSGGCAALVTLLFIRTLQMMLGGKHEKQLGPDDYCAAAFVITGDILSIFLHILSLLGLLDS